MLYVDTSALVKLVVAEAESAALTRFLRGREGPLVASALARTELLRAVRRYGDDEPAVSRAEEVLAGVGLVAVSASVLDAAAAVGPPDLWTLDAVHLATALVLADEMSGMVVYDERLAGAARLAGLEVLSPGRG